MSPYIHTKDTQHRQKIDKKKGEKNSEKYQLVGIKAAHTIIITTHTHVHTHTHTLSLYQTVLLLSNVDYFVFYLRQKKRKKEKKKNKTQNFFNFFSTFYLSAHIN